MKIFKTSSEREYNVYFQGHQLFVLGLSWVKLERFIEITKLTFARLILTGPALMAMWSNVLALGSNSGRCM